MKSISESVRTMRRSGIRAVMDVAFQLPDVLRLEVGDPDFPTPPHIVEAAAEAARRGYTHYTPSRGLSELREAMAAKLSSFNRLNVSPDEVVVTSGGGHALFSTFRAITEPGDAVLVPDPGWPNYRTISALCGVEPVGYHLPSEAGFDPDLDHLESLLSITPNVRLVIVNSPGNPTGAVWSEETLRAVVDLCAKYDVYLVSDEAYEAITFEGSHISTATVDESEHTVSVFTVSKTYAMTGWRVGYVVGPSEVVDAVGKVVENTVSCATAVAQKAAQAALADDQTPVAKMVEEYRRRRDLAVALLKEVGLEAIPPQGAFYVMVKVPAEDTMSFALDLIQARRVAVAPGEAFGPSGAGMVRLSLASDPATIEEGIRRLGEFVATKRSTFGTEV